MLVLNQIVKTFHLGTVNETKLFSDFSLSVAAGEFVSIVGSNGSGKTTMLNLVSGTVAADSGAIVLGNKDITNAAPHRRAKRIGRVYQDPTLGTSPSMTIAENLSIADNKGQSYGLAFGLNKKRLSSYRDELSKLGLGLEDKLHTKVGVLSGGQRQALALLMCTMTPIDLLLLDEHTAALDPKTSETIMELTNKIVSEKNLTTLMVTHNLKFAANYGSRLVMMDRGHIVLDKSGDDKAATSIDELLGVFNAISIECGN